MRRMQEILEQAAANRGRTRIEIGETNQRTKTISYRNNADGELMIRVSLLN